MQIKYNTDKKAIGRRLKEERGLHGYTQEKLSEIMGVTSKYMSKVENGTAVPSLPYILKFAEVTESDLNYLLLGREPVRGGYEGLMRDERRLFDDPAAKLSEKNRRICREMTKKMAEVLKKWDD